LAVIPSANARRQYVTRQLGADYGAFGMAGDPAAFAREHSPALKPCCHLIFTKRFSGAGDEIRTHDPNLGKVVLYP
jgi:hypothetical protein